MMPDSLALVIATIPEGGMGERPAAKAPSAPKGSKLMGLQPVCFARATIIAAIKAVMEMGPGPMAERTAPKRNRMMGNTFALPLQRVSTFLAKTSSVLFSWAMQNKYITPNSIKNILLSKEEMMNFSGIPVA